MKQFSLLFTIFCVSLCLSSCRGKEETDNAQLESNISPVIPKINSSVVSVSAEDNQAVKAGDVLVTLDDANYKIAVAQAEIGLEQAKQNVVLSQSNSKTASVSVSTVDANSDAVASNIASAQAGVEAARVKVNLAAKNYTRYEKLLEQKSASQIQYDVAKAEKDGAEAGLRIAEAQVNSIIKQVEAVKKQSATTQTQVSSSKDGIRMAQLAVKQAEQNLTQAKLLLSYCQIKAPTDGIISKKNVQPGQVISIGQPLMAVADNKNIWVIANYKETQLEKMKVGQPMEIIVDAYPKKVFQGKIESFAQATGAKFSLLPPDNATGNFVKVTQRLPIKIVFTEAPSNEYPLRAGMSVTTKLK